MQDIRNIAIIAHVDHGKTTLVDKMMLAGHLFRNDQTNGELVLDNNDLERERGITILSKNVSINYNGTKINIIDTPGHADFGGEVERVLNMADGCILLVDAFEGPMPQTRFVLQKALQIGLKPIVVVNKVDKPNCRPEEVYEMVFDLMFSLNATEDQLDFPVIYGSAKNNWMGEDWQTPTDSLTPLLDCIVKNIPAPQHLEGTPQMLITSLDYSAYTGRIAVGRVHRGTLKEGMNITLAKRDGTLVKSKIKELNTFEGLGRKKVESVSSGDICAIIGVEGFEIGDTICDFENPEQWKEWRFKTSRNAPNTEWGIGSAQKTFGQWSMYVSADKGATASYEPGQYGIVAYAYMPLEKGTYRLSFDWKALGVPGTDQLWVAVVPAADSTGIIASEIGKYILLCSLLKGCPSIDMFEYSLEFKEELANVN